MNLRGQHHRSTLTGLPLAGTKLIVRALGSTCDFFEVFRALKPQLAESDNATSKLFSVRGVVKDEEACMEMPSTRILVIEDFKPYRSLINSLLARNPALRIIGEARDGLEAVTQARQLTPDMILMDIGLPKLNGIEVARRIRELVPAAKIVFLTQETAVEIVHEALSLGAWGYIVKAEAETELLKGLAAILQGKRFVSSLAANGHGFT